MSDNHDQFDRCHSTKDQSFELCQRSEVIRVFPVMREVIGDPPVICTVISGDTNSAQKVWELWVFDPVYSDS